MLCNRVLDQDIGRGTKDLNSVRVLQNAFAFRKILINDFGTCLVVQININLIKYLPGIIDEFS